MAAYNNTNAFYGIAKYDIFFCRHGEYTSVENVDSLRGCRVESADLLTAQSSALLTVDPTHLTA